MNVKYEEQRKTVENDIMDYNREVDKIVGNILKNGFLKFKDNVDITTTHQIRIQYRSLNDKIEVLQSMLDRIEHSYSLMNYYYQNKE